VVFNAVFGKRASPKREREREEEEEVFLPKSKREQRAFIFLGYVSCVAKNSTHYSPKRSLLLF